MTAEPSRELRTPRLLLRPPTAADRADSLALWREPQVVRFIGGRPATVEEAWGRLLRYAGLWDLLGFGYWMVRGREDGRFLGEVGFSRFHRGLDAEFDDALEAGWVLRPEARGRGFAREALEAALDWAGAHTAAERVVCMISPDNAPSLKLAERVGFRHDRDAVYKDAPTRLLALRLSDRAEAAT